MEEVQSFQEAQAVFGRTVEIEQMSLYDAKESNESGDVADIQWYVESLSKSIVTLEEDLSIALTIAKKEKEVPLDEIRKWRSEQKEHINEFQVNHTKPSEAV